MRKFLSTILFACLCVATYAQSGKVTMSIIDASTKQGVVGAVVSIAPAAKPDDAKHFTSGDEGKLVIPAQKHGDYKLTISFLGYDDLTMDVKINSSNKNLGNIELTESTTKIDAVVKEVQAIRASQKGDTVSYNADAYKVASDADVEGLLKKMPGITIKNGSVEAQGETVKKIYVDGKEFFGEDVSTALNSLPAQAVKNIEVYNKLSDNAEFSGMDDGDSFKALNIVTQPGMRQGTFGKLFAGYGYQPETDDITEHHKYMAGGSVSHFNGASRLTVLGLFNNINKQNFSFEDIVGATGGTGGMGGGMGRGGVGQYMVRPQSGVAKVNAIGLNYSNSWGEKDKVKLQANYFFNNSKTRNLSETTTWYEAPLEDLGMLEQVSDSRNHNYNHRLGARVDWRISEGQSFMSRTNFSLQSYDPFSETKGMQLGDAINNLIRNGSSGDNGGYNLSEFMQYRLLLGKKGRFITVDGRINYRDNDNESRSHSNQATDGTKDLRYLENIGGSSNLNIGAALNYAEPVSKYAQVTMRYDFGFAGQENNRNTYNYGNDKTYTVGELDPTLSNVYSSDYMTHRVGPGFSWAKERNNFVVNLSYQYSTLDGQVKSTKSQPVKRSYNDFTYFMMGNFNFNKQNSLRVFLMSSTDNPRVQQLNTIMDISNVQYVSRGNDKLNPAYSHRLNLHYNFTNLEKARTLMWMFSFQTTQDYLAQSIYTGDNIPQDVVIEVGSRPIQYSTTENVDGYLDLRTHLNLGLPLNFMKCNLNIMGGVSYREQPSLINGEKNIASNIGYNAHVVLGSNISENVDFTLSWGGGFNQADNSLGTQGKNEYFNHNAEASFKAVFLKGFTFTASANYTQYIGYTNDYNDSFTLCNAFIGHKLFKNQLGEIMFGVNDIFNQNKAFSRSTGSGYTTNTWNSVIGRYFTVQFNYNLRAFGKKGSKNLSDYGISDGKSAQSGMHRMGPPMGGPGGPR